METVEFRMHKGARVALYIAGALCFILVVAAPIGLWMILRAAGGKVIVSPTEVKAKGLLTTTINLHDVKRIGICLVPIAAKGIGGALAKMKVGGDHGVNVCVMNGAGKTQKFIVSMYEDQEKIKAAITKIVNKPYEDIPMGLLGIKWAKEVPA
ncbi:MAG: hypothetical protein IT381_00930 [Deltaproteobacteria bacterium]|nr:hypothetical protein [Deltaproteobacteria bacterium]